MSPQAGKPTMSHSTLRKVPQPYPNLTQGIKNIAQTESRSDYLTTETRND